MPARTPALWPALAVASAAATLLAGCGGGGGPVSLADLARRQGAFAGKRVETAGTVREERDPDGKTYYVLADAAGDLVGLEPASEARRYLSERVEVSGRFELQRGFGRMLRIARIRSG